MKVDEILLKRALENASKRHVGKPEVIRFYRDLDANLERIRDSMETGTYPSLLRYSHFRRRNTNGKMRDIAKPSFETRILQHYFLLLAMPDYERLDPDVSFNCKPGYGITANKKGKSVVKRLKHVMYDRRELKYCLVIDQRKYYEHITKKLVRNALEYMGLPEEVITFGLDVIFDRNSFPIGTPTSPAVHHMVMLAFDRWLGGIPGPKVRYADDCILFFRNKEEANEAKWRIRQFWWYNYGMIAKRHTVRIVDVDRHPVDFCGLVVHRNPGKGICDHDKGYCGVRRGIKRRMKDRLSERSWPSYYGILSKTDSYRTLKGVSEKMKLVDLAARVKVMSKLDCPALSQYDFYKYTFDVVDYEIRKNSAGEPEWCRLMMNLHVMKDGKPMIRRVHMDGKYTHVVDFMSQLEAAYGPKAFLPMEDCKFIKVDGPAFEGSIEMNEWIPDDPAVPVAASPYGAVPSGFSAYGQR